MSLKQKSQLQGLADASLKTTSMRLKTKYGSQMRQIWCQNYNGVGVE